MVSKCQRWSNRGTEIRRGGEFMCLPLADRVLRSTRKTIEISYSSICSEANAVCAGF